MAGGKVVWAVQYRNFQAKKNKTWEKDGYLVIEGPGAKLCDDSGKVIGSKNLSKPLEEDDEITIGGKDVKIDAIAEDYDKASIGEESSHGTPAALPAAKAGYLTRPNGASSPAPSTLQSPSVRPPVQRPHNRPRSSLSTSTAPPCRADTPEVDDAHVSQPTFDSPALTKKKWYQPGEKLQKQFKVPTPARRTSPAVEYGPGKGHESGSRGTGDDGASARAALKVRQAAQEKSSRMDDTAKMATEKADLKGKGKAVREFDEDDGNREKQIKRSSTSPGRLQRHSSVDHEGSDGPTPPKKRKLDSTTVSTTSESTPALRKPRQSAADAALMRSMSNSTSSKPPTKASVPSSSKSQPLFNDRSPEKSTAPVSADDLDAIVLDASVFEPEKIDVDMDWGLDLGEENFEDIGTSDGSETESKAVTSKKPIGFSSAEVTRYFSCQWRKQSAKKSPVFDGDGVVRVVKSGQATLKDTDSGKETASGTLPKNASLDEGNLFRLGNKEIEIGTETNRQAFDGDSGSSQSTAKSAAAKPFAQPSLARATNPLASRASTPIARANPQPSSSSSRTSNFTLPGLSSGIASNSFYQKSNVTVNRGPRPLFDPSAPNAVVMPRPDADHEKTYNEKKFPVVDVVIDPIIGDKLKPHQKDGVRFMYSAVMGMSTAGQGCINADAMGLGKTIQSIALIHTLLKQTPYFGSGGFRRGTIDRAMIVCPVTLVKNWANEIKKWLPKDVIRVMVADSPNSIKTFANVKSYQVLIVGYEKLRTAIDDVRFAQPPVGLVICDEGHRLKSNTSETSKTLRTLPCQRRVILSGTPIQNNLGEYFAMMDFVNPGLLNTLAYFKKHYEQPIMTGRASGASKKQREAAQEAQESLAEIARNFLIRRTNDDIEMTLPPRLDYTVFFIPTKLEMQIYSQVLQSSKVRNLLNGNQSEQLKLLTLLQKCANTPGLLMKQAETEKEMKDPDSIFDSDLKAVFPQTEKAHSFGLSAKLNGLGRMLAELHRNSDEKIVVVSNFTSTLDIVERHCKSNKYKYCRLDGQTDQKSRIPMVEQFNKGNREYNFIFLLSSKSGGTGLNIIGASRLVLLDSDWNPSNDLQAMARIHRDGQKRTCVIYRFLTVGTIDEKIYQRQITKLALSGSVMEEDAGSTSKKGGQDAFSADDLRNIFTLHEETSCQTHDLLDCRCHTSEPESSQLNSQDLDEDDGSDTKRRRRRIRDEDDSDEDSEEDDEMQGFVPASQWKEGDSDKKAIKARKNLSILKTWTHYDCSQRSVVSSIEDDLLKTLAFRIIAKVDPNERDVTNYDDMNDEERQKIDSGESWMVKGSQIGWVFGKCSKRKEEARRVVVDYGGEESD